jgi:nucleotide-binding universal stress UspA family protein
LVLVGQSRKDLKGVHYALSLAERLQAQVFVLQEAAGDRNPVALWLDEALPELINQARDAGLSVSHLIASRPVKEKIVLLAREEGIDLVIIGGDDETCYWLPHQIKPLVPSQIIQVSEKNQVRYL